MVEFAGLRVLVGELGVMPGEVRSGLRVGFRAAGQVTLEHARGNASWSSRIPGAMGLRVSTSGRNTGVMLRVNSARAPHARPYEGIDGRGTFRHPVYGDRDTWVAQATRPFLRPAIEATRPAYLKAAEEAVTRAARSGGFH